MENLPDDFFVTSQQFTKQTYRDVYPAVDPSDPKNSQAGKVVVITGASRGIGRKILILLRQQGFAASFAKAGPRALVLVARSAETLGEVAKEVQAIDEKIQVLNVPTNLGDITSVAALWEKVRTTFGHADVLINNAAIMTGFNAIADAPIDEWWSDFEVNVRGTFAMTQGFLKLLGKHRPGSVINMTSFTATIIFPNSSAYSLSKLVSWQIQAYVAVENPNVTAVALHPCIVMTDMTAEAVRRFAKDTPELVGGVGVWLASEEASWLTGRQISVNWAVDELVERKDEIVSEDKLKLVLSGKFGKEQFS